MPLSSLGLTNSVVWALSANNSGGWNPTQQGPQSLAWTIAGVNLETYNQIIAVNTTIAPSGTYTTFLNEVMTNLVCETFTPTSVLTVITQPTGGPVQFGPAEADPFQWWFNSTSSALIVPAGGLLVMSCGPAGSTYDVSGSNYALSWDNNGATTITVDIIIIVSS